MKFLSNWKTSINYRKVAGQPAVCYISRKGKERMEEMLKEKDPMYFEGIIGMADYVINLMEDYSKVCVDVTYDYEQWLTMHMERAKSLAERRLEDIIDDMEYQDIKHRAGQPAERSEHE